MRVLHFADVHAEDGAKYPEIKKCLLHIVEQAENARPELIAVPGDIFNSSEVKLDSRAAKLVFAAFSRLASVAPVVVSIGTPSHDGKAAEVLQHIPNIYVATTPQQFDLPCALVTAIPAPTKQFLQGTDTDIAAAMTQIFMGFGAAAADRGDKPHIMLGHWNAEGTTINGQDYIGHEITIGYDAMMLADPDIVCLGHIHCRQQIRRIVFYPGGIYQKNYGEIGDKGAWIHTFNGRSLTGSRFEHTPCRRLFVDRLNCCDGIESPKTAGCDGCEVRCEITCWQDMAGAISQDLYRKVYFDAGAESVEVRLIRVPRQTVRNDLVLKAHSLREKLVAMAELRGETVPSGILLKADALEAHSADEIINNITGRAAHNENKAA